MKKYLQNVKNTCMGALDSLKTPATGKIVLATALTVASGAAMAGAGGAELNGIYATISELASGSLNKIVTLCAFCFGIFNVFKQNWAMSISALVAALALSNITDIVDMVATAGLPI